MPADYTKLQAAVDALTLQVAATEGTEGSAVALIQGFAAQVSAAVAAALTADAAANQGSIDAAQAAIDTVTARFVASGKALGDAVAAVPVNPLKMGQRLP
jgi:hypothetical protein